MHSPVTSHAAARKYRLTRNKYSEKVDIEEMAKHEFGPSARVAEWKDIKREWSGRAVDFMDQVGLTKHGDSAFVLRGGKRFLDGRRHYNMTRLDGRKPGNFLAHDSIDSHQLSLGSWYGLRLQILAVVDE